MTQKFIDHLNAAVEKLNYGDRSKLIRDAIIEKLNREGVETPKSLAAAPVRVGKKQVIRRKNSQSSNS